MVVGLACFGTCVFGVCAGVAKTKRWFHNFVIACFVLVWEYFGNFGASELCYVGLRVYTASELVKFSIFGGCICIYLLW